MSGRRVAARMVGRGFKSVEYVGKRNTVGGYHLDSWDWFMGGIGTDRFLRCQKEDNYGGQMGGAGEGLVAV